MAILLVLASVTLYVLGGLRLAFAAASLAPGWQLLIGFGVGLPVMYVIMGFIEYISHRYFMHNRRGGFMFRDHHQKHHGRHDMSLRLVDLGIKYHLVVSSPLWLFLLYRAAFVTWMAWGTLAAFAAIIVWHSQVWSYLHRNFHDLESNWTQRLWCYGELRRHHLDHHRRPGTNFGVLYFWVDRLAGTFWRSPEGT